jgi:hypothetical protein
MTTYRATRKFFIAEDGDTLVGRIGWEERGRNVHVLSGEVAEPGSGEWIPMIQACAQYLADNGYILRGDTVQERGSKIRWGRLIVHTDGHPNQHDQVVSVLQAMAPLGETRRILAVVRESDADAVETAFGVPGWFSVGLENNQGTQVARVGQWRPGGDDAIVQRFLDAGVPARFATIRTTLDGVSGSDRLLLFDADLVSLQDVLDRFSLTVAEDED